MKEIVNQELIALTLPQLEVEADELRRELFQLRLRVVTSPSKSFPSDQRKLKRSIARVLTHIRLRELQG